VIVTVAVLPRMIVKFFGVAVSAKFPNGLTVRAIVVVTMGSDPRVGRAREQSGATTKARSAYQDFALWKDADPDEPSSPLLFICIESVWWVGDGDIK
jgi:hypothetical protein